MTDVRVLVRGLRDVLEMADDGFDCAQMPATQQAIAEADAYLATPASQNDLVLEADYESARQMNALHSRIRNQEETIKGFQRITPDSWCAAFDTLSHLGYIYLGGEQWKPPLRPAPDFERENVELRERLALEDKAAEREIRYQADRAMKAESELSALRAKIAEAPTWLPIDSAPKDGTEILVYSSSEWEGYAVAAFSGDWWYVCDEYPASPTHYMPLPEPPK